jgi:hypothetical protein
MRWATLWAIFSQTHLITLTESPKPKRASKNNWLHEESGPKDPRIPYRGLTQCLIIGLTLLFVACYAAVATAYYNNVI